MANRADGFSPLEEAFFRAGESVETWDHVPEDPPPSWWERLLSWLPRRAD